MLQKKNKMIQSVMLTAFFLIFFTLTAEKSFAQQPFSTLDDYLHKNNLTYSSMSYDENFIKLVKAERVRLAKNFEPELFKYLGKDLTKYYWMDLFIENDGHFKGDGSGDPIAHKIRIQAIQIPIDKDDLDGLGKKITLMREVAFDMNFAGQREQAIGIKKQIEQLIKDNEDVKGYVGASEGFLICVYDNLENNPNTCKKDNL